MTYAGSRSDWTISRNGNSIIVKDGNGNRDILTSVEWLEFDDGRFAVGDPGNGDVTLTERFTLQGHVLAAVMVEDYDRDGQRDIAIGRKDSVEVVSGRDGALLRSFLFQDEDFSEFGASLALIGDLNGDGFGELIVGAPDATAVSSSGGDGSAFVLDATAGVLLREVDAPRSQLSADFGAQVMATGDIDGDGVPDWLASQAFIGGIDNYVAAFLWRRRR